MKKTHRFWLFALLFGVALGGCRSNLGGMPYAAPPAAGSGAPAGSLADAMKVPERVMSAGKIIGSSNTLTADMPVPRPDTAPCVVTLFRNVAFKNFNNKTFSYKPPATCPGPWAKVVFNFDVRVTKGVQYDRTGIIWVDGAVVYFGTTAEPSSTLAPHWHVERDATNLSALFKSASQGQIELWNCYCPPTYNGYQVGTAYVQFYPPDKKYPAPPVPDDVIGVPYSPPLGGVATLPQSAMEIQKMLPRDITGAYLDLYLQSQDKEEQWFMDVPDVIWRHSKHELGFSRGTAFREGLVTVDGTPAGISPIFPWIYTGGIDPYLWFPLPGVQTLEFVPYRVNLTPFAAELSNGQMQTIGVRVFRAFDYFSGAGDLLIYRDPHHHWVTGALTQDTLAANPPLDLLQHIAYGSGLGLFGGPTASGTVDTRSYSAYTIAGYAVGSRGKVTTTVNSSSLFSNKQNFSYTSRHYEQLMMQDTVVHTTTTTQFPSSTHSLVESYNFPLTISYPFLPLTSGFRLPLKIYQGYRATIADGKYTTNETNTVDNIDTMLFSPAGQWTGVRNGASLQLYTYTSKHEGICYGKEIKAKNNAVTVVSEPGCSAVPPRRPYPHA